MIRKRHFFILFALCIMFVSGFAFTSEAEEQAAENVHTSSEGPFTIIRDGFWHITYDDNNVASCKFYKMPIRSPRGATFSYAKNAWVCEPYQTRTLWYYVGDDEYLAEGWQNIDGVWYYFEERTGRMYTDETTPDGRYMGPDGALVR